MGTGLRPGDPASHPSFKIKFGLWNGEVSHAQP